MNKPLMAKATAVWLVDNTTLSFKQIGDFCGLHELEVQGIADGDVAAGVKGYDPVASNQLDPEEIKRAEASPIYRMRLKHNPAADGEEKRRGPRYTPLSKRQDRPAAILWLVKFHPELADAQIAKLVGLVAHDFAQDTAHNFSAACLGQVSDAHDPLWCGKGTDGSANLHDKLLGQILSSIAQIVRLESHKGCDRLASHFVRRSDRCRLSYTRVQYKRRLNFRCRHAVA